MKKRLTPATLKTLMASPNAYDVRDTHTPGLLVRVEPSGALTYYCDYRADLSRRRTRYRLGRCPTLTLDEARREALKILGEVARGNDPSATRKEKRAEIRGQVTFGEFLEGDFKRFAEHHYADSSQEPHRLQIVLSEFLKTPLAGLSVQRFDEWKAKRLGQGITPQTVNREIAILKSSLAKALDWGLIKHHPLLKLKLAKAPQEFRVRFLSADEELRLRAALDERDLQIKSKRDHANSLRRQYSHAELPSLQDRAFADHLKPMVLLSINTAIRRGELFKLLWSDIDFSDKQLKVRAAAAKSRKARFVPLNREALATLELWRACCDEGSELVFPSKNGKKFDNITSSWESLLKQAKITGFRWHDLRHHVASRMVQKGVDLNRVRAVLGHSDMKMTLRYAHLSNAELAGALGVLDS